jgi:hypothetical protein
MLSVANVKGYINGIGMLTTKASAVLVTFAGIFARMLAINFASVNTP